MKYLHTMIRVADLDASLDFFVNKLGFVEQRRHVNEKGRFTLVFVAAPESPDAPVELTYNWDPEIYTVAGTSAIWRLRLIMFTTTAPS